MTAHGGFTVTTSAGARERCLAFVREYQAAPNDADIDFRVGRSEAGETAVGVSINGKHHAFTVREATTIADICERTLQEMGRAAIGVGLENLILGLRATVKAAARSRSP